MNRNYSYKVLAIFVLAATSLVTPAHAAKPALSQRHERLIKLDDAKRMLGNDASQCQLYNRYATFDRAPGDSATEQPYACQLIFDETITTISKAHTLTSKLDIAKGNAMEARAEAILNWLRAGQKDEQSAAAYNDFIFNIQVDYSAIRATAVKTIVADAILGGIRNRQLLEGKHRGGPESRQQREPTKTTPSHYRIYHRQPKVMYAALTYGYY